jgi:hypothetical protein
MHQHKVKQGMSGGSFLLALLMGILPGHMSRVCLKDLITSNHPMDILFSGFIKI